MHRLPGPILVIALLAAGCSAGAEEPMASPAPPTTSEPSVAASRAPGPAPSEAAATAEPTPGPSAATFDDPLLALELTDVRDGRTFTLGELAADAPVIVETMAIWCTNCASQMREVTAAHGLAEFHSVSVDVEPTEIAEDLAAYSDREGFDWPFVMADASLATQLRERFGNAVLLPPGMPKLLIRTDGSVELLPIGQLLSAEQIADLVEG